MDVAADLDAQKEEQSRERQSGGCCHHHLKAGESRSLFSAMSHQSNPPTTNNVPTAKN